MLRRIRSLLLLYVFSPALGRILNVRSFAFFYKDFPKPLSVLLFDYKAILKRLESIQRAFKSGNGFGKLDSGSSRCRLKPKPLEVHKPGRHTM